jgi:hypothetical protein
METDSNFKVGRGNKASPARCFVPTDKANSEENLLAAWPVLQQTLQSLPDSRPDAVARAKQLIADPDYPPQEMIERMAYAFVRSLAFTSDNRP